MSVSSTTVQYLSGIVVAGGVTVLLSRAAVVVLVVAVVVVGMVRVGTVLRGGPGVFDVLCVAGAVGTSDWKPGWFAA